ncbi:SDR family oxidoreductase [Methylophaga sp. OBS4]|uniref:SDR family oxidoreductase n=1 Tax=Methylophaga sp. OBS4 TaxID=2991935 RepID=UPI00224E95A9|nr:SDR family oxidoreductase [Methylophaga sp. OBS4]MCX4186844.1 SDR family oxidoreductase [Methylophaga sp. OBS4]
MGSLSSKLIVLTGAAGGIGQAVAKALSAEGARLVLTDRNEPSLTALNQALGNKHHIVTADISTGLGRKTLHDYCESLFGAIDMVVNMAGINRFALLSQHSDEDIERIIYINLVSQIALTRLMLPLLLKKEQTVVVNFGSTLGSIGLPGYSVYSASKFGLRGFSEALNRELMDTPVSVRYFAPRATQTPLNDDKVSAMNAALGNAMDSPEVVAQAFIKFLQQSTNRYYLGWPEKLFVRINSLLPGLVDKSIFKQLPIIKRFL